MKGDAKIVAVAVLVVGAVVVGGYLYFTSRVPGASHGMEGDHTSAPGLVIKATPTEGAAPLTVTFEAPSMIGDSHPSYRWDFGDGTSGRGRLLSHTYETPGTYTAACTATLDDGSTQTASVKITVRR